jgi:hypothetical protein
MNKFASFLRLFLVLVIFVTPVQAFCCSHPSSSPLLISSSCHSTTGNIRLTSAAARDVSLAFLKRDATKPKYFETSEEEVIPRHPDDISPVEHSHPSVDQDARWMEEEATTEVLSVFAVFALVALADLVYQTMNM